MTRSGSITRRDTEISVTSGPMAAVDAPAFAAPPSGTVTIARHLCLAPIWFDPGDSGGLATADLRFYGLHDAPLQPIPEGHAPPHLATAHRGGPDGLTNGFVMRDNVAFPGGDPVASAGAGFSFQRYRGANAKLPRDIVASVETPDPRRIAFRLKQAWPGRASSRPPVPRSIARLAASPWGRSRGWY